MIYFISDLHFDHFNIIKYCKRPYKTTEEMNFDIIRNINNVCKPNDTLYHVGDYVFKSKPREFEQAINCKIVFIKGNHDPYEWPEIMTITMGGINFLVQHRPPTQIAEIPDFCDAVICGHEHNNWKLQSMTRQISENKIQIIPIINVSCDNWEFKPLDKNQLIAKIKSSYETRYHIIKEKNSGIEIIEFGGTKHD